MLILSFFPRMLRPSIKYVRLMGKMVWGVIEIVSVLSLIMDQVIQVQAMDSVLGGETSGAAASLAGDGKKWAVLVAGSNDYSNYRHQADICHAYQILRKGGLNDENIIVFMYDDIAFNEYNPRPGIIINKPDGGDVYAGVPKDYTGEHVNSENLYAVILGNKSAVVGGSRKVVDSGPNDYVFIYYADHGGAGILGMPGDDDFVLAKDLIEVLKKKHEANAYKSMLIYVEACEAGSIFEGLLPDNISVYATTAANSSESSYGTYCPYDYPAPPLEFDTCLGDTFSISWMEDSDKHDMRNETLKQQYDVVRRRTVAGEDTSSHVQNYGDLKIEEETLYTFMGSHNSYATSIPTGQRFFSRSVSQRDANLVHFRQKLLRASSGSQQWRQAKEKLVNEMTRREWEDKTIAQIGSLLLGSTESEAVMNGVRPPGKPVVDDWVCLKTFIKTYETHCGKLSKYGMKHSRALANLCNAGVSEPQMAVASVRACSNKIPSLSEPYPGL